MIEMMSWRKLPPSVFFMPKKQSGLILMNDNPLALTLDTLLSPLGLTPDMLSCALNKALCGRDVWGDLYLQARRHESWSLEDGIVKEGHYGLSQGFGLRVVNGEKSGFAYGDGLELARIERAADSARAITRSGQTKQVAVVRAQSQLGLYTPESPLSSWSDDAKIALLTRLDKKARAMDPTIEHVMIRLSAQHESVMVLQSSGELAADIRPLVSLHITVIANKDGRREKGSAGGGGRSSYDIFSTDDFADRLLEKAVKQALVNCDAISAPAGTMPVVLGPGWPAVLLHEAVGHGLEGDFNRKGSSAFSGRIGERVATDVCTVVDDGTIENRRGSLSIDDEGIVSQCTTLIEKGILTGYMQDRQNAALMGQASTGNGRRESYAHLPLPRMTNTYMLPGEHEPDEIIASVDRGIYAVDFAGGQVDITSGKFVFSSSEAYLIEKGRVTAPIKGVTLIGDGPDVLTKVSMVGNDLALDQGLGNCGKAGQTVPVGVGQPTIKVDEMVVGGA